MASKPWGKGTEGFGFNFIFSGKKKWIGMRNWSSTVWSSCRNIVIDFWRNGMCHLVCLGLLFSWYRLIHWPSKKSQPKQTPLQINKQNLLDFMETKLTSKSLMWLLWSHGGWGKILLEILLLGLNPQCSVVAMVNSFSKDHVDTWGWNSVIYFELWGI